MEVTRTSRERRALLLSAICCGGAATFSFGFTYRND